MAKRGGRSYFRLATACSALEKSELELAHALGLSLAALKAIDRPGAPLYLKLALTALMTQLEPDPLFHAQDGGSDRVAELPRMEFAG